MLRIPLPKKEKIQESINNQNLTITDICKKLDMSYPTFRKICKQLKLVSRSEMKMRAVKFIVKQKKCGGCQHPFDVCICGGIAHG